MDEIYAYKSSKTNTNPKPVVPVSTGDSEKTTGTSKQQDKPESYNWGQAGRTVLGDIIKPDPTILTAIGGFLHEAYQAGLNGLDLSEELAANARAGGVLGEIETMYKAGETDAKIAADSRSSETVPQMGAEDDNDVPYMGAAPNADTAGGISQWEKDYEYIRKMMIYCGGLKNKDPDIQKAIEFFMNSKNKGEYIPPRVFDAFENLLNTVDDERKIKIAMRLLSKFDYDYSYESLKKRNEELKKQQDNQGGFNFKYPTADFSDVNQRYGVWYEPEEGYHMGIDIGEADGKNSNILAAYGGEIVFSDLKGENGYMIIIQHTANINGEEITFYTSYSHLKEKDRAPKGTEVKPGDQIGIMGSTGNSTGTHLHFAIFTTSMPLDLLSPYGYGSYQISDYAWKSSSSGHTIYYDPKEVFKTYGAIIQETLNSLKKKSN